MSSIFAFFCFFLLSTTIYSYHLTSNHLTSQLSQQSDTGDPVWRITNETLETVLRLNEKCAACEVVVEALQILVKVNASMTEIEFLIKKACIFLKIETERVCSTVVQEFGPEFVTVFANLLLHPKWLCYAAVGPSCGEPADVFPFWNVTIPGNKPPRKPLVRPAEGLPTLKVVQLSDVHIDLMYRTNSSKICNEPLCCRDGTPNSPSEAAGFWGSLGANCDIPLRTYENALQFIAEEIKPDVIFLTGDIPAHDVWKQSRGDQLQRILLTADLLTEFLPGTRVLPSLGNHESSPVDSFPPPGVAPPDLSNQWLNLFVQKVWSRWLPPESLDTVGYAGFYGFSFSHDLRIISLNTQYCDNLNFWLYLNNTDPGGQLQWLVDELTWAETYGVKVIILGHIPTGNSDCFKAFSWNYYNIVDRFEDTIVGQFVGHTHQDHFKMMYSTGSTAEEGDHHPTGFQFISPSLTTFQNMRPAIRVYTLDGLHSKSTYRPLKHETYLFDMERANKKNETAWELEYSTDTAYNLTWLTPDTMQGVYERLAADRAYFNATFWNFMYHENGDTCSDECYTQELCRIKTGRSHDPSICPKVNLKSQISYTLNNKMC